MFLLFVFFLSLDADGENRGGGGGGRRMGVKGTRVPVRERRTGRFHRFRQLSVCPYPCITSDV